MKYLALLLLVLAGFVACRKEQPKMNAAQNACDCVEEVSADFLMEESYGFEGQVWHYYTNTDTAFFNKNIRFSAIEKNADVTWYLGQEIEKGNKVARHFSENFAGQSLPVICVVKKKPNLKCLPNDDGYDSIVKYIHISSRPQNDTSYLLEGIFRLKEENSTDSIDMQVVFKETVTSSIVIDLFNYDGKGGNYLNQLGTGFNFREIRYNMNGHRGKIVNALNGKVTIEIIAKPNGLPSYRYTGRKL